MAITRAGGLVKYSWGWTKANPGMVIKRSDPGRLADLIGVDYLGHVTDVWLTASPNVTDATVRHVGRLTRLKKLRLDQSSVNDASLAELTGLTSLSSLDLEGTRVSDAGLAHLKSLKNLSRLVIDGTRITDAGVNELKQALPNLRIEH